MLELALIAGGCAIVVGMLRLWFAAKAHALMLRREARAHFERLTRAITEHREADENILQHLEFTIPEMYERRMPYLLLVALTEKLRDKQKGPKKRNRAKPEDVFAREQYSKEMQHLLAATDYFLLKFWTARMPILGFVARSLMAEMLRPDDSAEFDRQTTDMAQALMGARSA